MLKSLKKILLSVIGCICLAGDIASSSTNNNKIAPVEATQIEEGQSWYNLYVTQVSFRDVEQPVRGEVAPLTTTVPMSAKYKATLTWSPNLVDGKFDYGKIYTVSVHLTILDRYITDDPDTSYGFADDVTLHASSGTGWTKSDLSDGRTLIYTKTFERTEAKIVSYHEIDEDGNLIVHYENAPDENVGYVGCVGNDNTLPIVLGYVGIGLGALSLIGVIILLAIKQNNNKEEE